MKAYLNIAFLAATMVVGSAVAAPPDVRGDMHMYPQSLAQESNAPALSRAEVVAQIPATGAPVGSEVNYPQEMQVASSAAGLTRDQVKSELAAAQANGTFLTGTINYPVSNY